MKLTGVIACGGESSRMGSDKSLLIYHEVKQREHLLEMLAPFCEEVFLSLNSLQKDDHKNVIIDNPEFYGLGPATGLLSAFRNLPGKNILFIGCDYPFLSEKELRRFIETATPGNISSFFNHKGYYEPLLSIIPYSCRERLVQHLQISGSLQKSFTLCNAYRYSPLDPASMQSVDERARFNAIMKMGEQKQYNIVRSAKNGFVTTDDTVAVEEPLQINIISRQNDERIIKPLAVTMRTPGSDAELARGFLITEGIISYKATVVISHTTSSHEINIECADENPVLTNIERNFYATSSCGVCGKSSISKIKIASPKITSIHSVKEDLLRQLPSLLRENQVIFRRTGGLHACALFNEKGDLIFIKEDVGRHNAMDKLAGALAGSNKLPADCCILLLSGRAGFEMIQKAAMCGIPIIAAVGAPTSLAIETAEECNITLVGFLKETGFNIYTHPFRIETAI